MRIAHISDCYFPRLGGIETQVRTLAGQQAATGDDVIVITATPGHDGVRAGLDRVDDIDVYRVVARMPFELPVHPRTKIEVMKVLTAHPVDVVHVHAGVVSPFAWGAIRAAAELKIPTLVTVHSMWGPVARPMFSAGDRLVRWKHVRWSAVSTTAARDVNAALGVDVSVVPNGIDVTSWSGREHVNAPDAFRIVAVMRLAPRKRVGPLLRILQQTIATLQDTHRVTAVIAGSGPIASKAQRFIDSNELSANITLAGRLSHDELLDVFAASDVFVQPSVRESFGLAALEARTAGLPVVVRAQSGSVDFVTPEIDGLVADDDAGMVDALVELARNTGLRDRIASHNRQAPPEQAWPAVLSRVSAEYAQAIRT